MKAPICDFVRGYAAADPLRLHMPGHKGTGPLGVEALDITEIPGADTLYDAGGIIRESEENAAALFGSRRTCYSCEGSSLAVRAMLLLAVRFRGGRRLIWAGRNAHRSFWTAAALLDLTVRTLPCGEFLSGSVDPSLLERELETAAQLPAAVYVTSPDYLGGMADVAALAGVCHRRGVLLLVDSAHGAYLAFLRESRHPLQLGADLCCDSAHKTLPVLTGGAYLHTGRCAPEGLEDGAEQALALFGSTSPSYLILQSLDAFNKACAEGWRESLQAFVPEVARLRRRLEEGGWALHGQEPMKLTLCPKGRGYTGQELQEALARHGAAAEYADPDYLVLMPAPATGADGLRRLAALLETVPPRPPVPQMPPPLPACPRRLSPRQALLGTQALVPAAQSVGQVLGECAIACPPAVPVAACGEEITPEAAACFRYYGVERVSVVRQPFAGQ